MSEGRDIIEPAQWHQRDDMRGRVLDHNYDPPRVVRYVGWRPCIRCGRKFCSSDVAEVRICIACKDVQAGILDTIMVPGSAAPAVRRQ